MINLLRLVPGVITVVLFLAIVSVTQAQLQLQAVPVETDAAPAHTPEWTDYNESDPGVAELEVSEDVEIKEGSDSGSSQDKAVLDSKEKEQDENKLEIDFESVGSSGGSDSEHKDWIIIESMSSPSEAPGTELDDIGTPAVAEPGTEQQDIGIVGTDTDSGGKESGEKGGTADINIGVGELQEMNKSDLIDRLATEPVEARAVFVKYGDIKGESDDSDGSDDGEAAKKPKEIIVVGSKVRGWDPVKKKEITGAAPIDPDGVSSPEDLALFLTVGTEADARMEEVSFNYEKIKFDYNTEVKILWLFSVPMKASYEVDMDQDSESLGRIKVKMPWWHVFGRKTVRSHDLAAVSDPKNPDGNENVQAASVFKSVSDALKSAHKDK